jgi:hypothetical protein
MSSDGYKVNIVPKDLDEDYYDEDEERTNRANGNVNE